MVVSKQGRDEVKKKSKCMLRSFQSLNSYVYLWYRCFSFNTPVSGRCVVLCLCDNSIDQCWHRQWTKCQGTDETILAQYMYHASGAQHTRTQHTTDIAQLLRGNYNTLIICGHAGVCKSNHVHEAFTCLHEAFMSSPSMSLSIMHCILLSVDTHCIHVSCTTWIQ